MTDDDRMGVTEKERSRRAAQTDQERIDEAYRLARSTALRRGEPAPDVDRFAAAWRRHHSHDEGTR